MRVKKYKAFTLIEVLIASGLSIILMTSAINIYFIIMRLLVRQNEYVQVLQDSQYLYWHFYNNLTNSVGIQDIQEIIENDCKDNCIKIVQDYLYQKQQHYQLEIISKNELKRYFNQLGHGSSLLDMVISESSILMLNNYKITNDKSLRYTRDFYFIVKLNNNVDSSLYYCTNNRCEEMLRNIKSFQVEYINNRYYLFSLTFSCGHYMNFAIGQGGVFAV